MFNESSAAAKREAVAAARKGSASTADDVDDERWSPVAVRLAGAGAAASTAALALAIFAAASAAALACSFGSAAALVAWAVATASAVAATLTGSGLVESPLHFLPGVMGQPTLLYLRPESLPESRLIVYFTPKGQQYLPGYVSFAHALSPVRHAANWFAGTGAVSLSGYNEAEDPGLVADAAVDAGLGAVGFTPLHFLGPEHVASLMPPCIRILPPSGQHTVLLR